MVAKRLELKDWTFDGMHIPKEFCQFCMSIFDYEYEAEPNIQRILTNALQNVDTNGIIKFRSFLKSLIEKGFSDEYLRRLFLMSGANIVFEKPTQTEIIKQILALPYSHS